MASSQLEGQIRGTAVPDVSAFRTNANQVVGWNGGPVVMNRARHEAAMASDARMARIGTLAAVGSALVGALVLTGTLGGAAGAKIAKDAMWAGAFRSAVQQFVFGKDHSISPEKLIVDTAMRPLSRISDDALGQVFGKSGFGGVINRAIQTAVAESLQSVKNELLGKTDGPHLGKAGIGKLASDAAGAALDAAFAGAMGKDKFEPFKETAAYQVIRNTVQGGMKSLAEFAHDEVTAIDKPSNAGSAQPESAKSEPSKETK